MDKPIAGLLKDLKRRGLLDETIVLFASEFGRTPGTQGSDGRDHHIYGFSVFMAGMGEGRFPARFYCEERKALLGF